MTTEIRASAVVKVAVGGKVYPVGTCARYDESQYDNQPDAAIGALPKGAKRLLDAAKANGWLWALAWSVDTGGSPFVNMVIGRGKPDSPRVGQYEISACWHTRDTGTPRLFNCLARSPGRGWYHVGLQDMLSLVTENPTEPATQGP